MGAISPAERRNGSAIEIQLEDLAADPHGVFRHYRPLTAALKAGPTFYLLRARDVIGLMTDTRTRQFDGAIMPLRGYPATGPMADFMTYSLLLSNDEVHRRRRKPLARSFARPVMEPMRKYVREEAERIADDLPRGRDFDFLEYYASPFPGRVIATTAGLERDDWHRFARLIYRMTTGFAPPFPADRWESIEAAAAEMYRFVSEAIEERRARPREDFVTTFLKSAADAGELSEIEIRSQLLAVLLGGSDTTRGALANMHGLLLEHPEQWRAVCNDPKLINGAIDEALRFEPPVASTPRMAGEAMSLDGIDIPAGSPLELMTMSAMRDPELYPDPDRFDIRRTDLPKIHPVFGGGTHRCIGEYLARMELEEGLRAMATRHPGMRLVGTRVVPAGFSAVRESKPVIVHIPA